MIDNNIIYLMVFLCSILIVLLSIYIINIFIILYIYKMLYYLQKFLFNIYILEDANFVGQFIQKLLLSYIHDMYSFDLKPLNFQKYIFSY